MLNVIALLPQHDIFSLRGVLFLGVLKIGYTGVLEIPSSSSNFLLFVCVALGCRVKLQRQKHWNDVCHADTYKYAIQLTSVGLAHAHPDKYNTQLLHVHA